MTPCFHCNIDLFPPQTKFPLCTLAETPRNAAHCIEYAHLIQWGQERPGESFDADSPDHMKWIYEQARGQSARMLTDIPGISSQLRTRVKPLWACRIPLSLGPFLTAFSLLSAPRCAAGADPCGALQHPRGHLQPHPGATPSCTSRLSPKPNLVQPGQRSSAGPLLQLTPLLSLPTRTQGVVKNIIPAIPSTNAIVAASCALEAVKIATCCSTGMNNYMMCVFGGHTRHARRQAPRFLCQRALEMCHRSI